MKSRIAFAFLLPSLLLLGATPRLNAQQNQTASKIYRHSYTTAIGINLPRNEEDYFVYTPPGYDPQSPSKYPVLYLLHGYEQSAGWWQTNGDLQAIMDELIAQKKARPMIVVMPAGYGDYKFFLGGLREWASKNRVQENGQLFAEMLGREIIPRVESEYKVSTKREDQAIAGLSMGGREALQIALGNFKKFAWVGCFSAAFPTFPIPFRYRFILPDPAVANFRLLWVGYGISDELTRKANAQLVADLNQKGYEVTSVLTHGGHSEVVWRDDIKRFIPLLFQPK
jgi:enterochelin esterase-like enzyme